MLRIICKVVSTCPEGAVDNVYYRAFQMPEECGDLETFLRTKVSYQTAYVCGAEPLPPEPAPQSFPTPAVKTEDMPF